MKRTPAKPDPFPLIGSRKYPWNQPKGNQPTGEELGPLAPPLPKRRGRRLLGPVPHEARVSEGVHHSSTESRPDSVPRERVGSLDAVREV